MIRSTRGTYPTVNNHNPMKCYLVAHSDVSLLLNSIACLGRHTKTIDNFLGSGIIEFLLHM
jgi:hypothetical protein